MGNISELNVPSDTSPVEPMKGSVLPKGTYKSALKNSEVRDSKSGGKFLNLDFEVLEGEFAGRHFFGMLNLIVKPKSETLEDKEKAATAERIGRGQLSALSRACHFKLIPDESFALHDIPLEIKLSVRPAKGQYDESNNIVEFIELKQEKPVVFSQSSEEPEIPFEDDNIPF